MYKREMTLGEEIINLTKNGVDVTTVERMYKKIHCYYKRNKRNRRTLSRF